MNEPIALSVPIELDVSALGLAVAGEPDWRERAAGWLGGALSLGVLVLVVWQLGRIGIGHLVATAPHSPIFWATFALCYLASPACEWVIFHRLWRIPATGLLALLRKEVSNELLFGYSGEAQFYLWARRHVSMTGSPFGAVKDVAMLSAVAGNLATLALMVATGPMLIAYATTPLAKAFGGSVAIIIGMSLTIFVARRALFSLPRRELWMVFWVHIARIVANVALTATMWHLLLPSVALGGWMLLATLRMMISRMPLVANKDMLFAGMALLLLGKSDGVAEIVTMVSSLIVVAHVAVGALTYSGSVAARIANR